ncbi:MAG: phenylacetate--CoA ligase, partial [Candidatus Atribacteria bacterium]|nr:phenylacetate--CoA ligase [Candidatus Atribacteria bacterium]
VEVEVEVSPEIFSDEIKVLENMKRKIEEKMKAELNISCQIKLIRPKSIVRSEGKAKRVVDLRKKEGSQ